LITAVGGLESDEFKRQTALIAQAWHANHRAGIPLPDANHLTICDAFATPGHPLCEAAISVVSSIG
jgi:arylformamidase